MTNDLAPESHEAPRPGAGQARRPPRRPTVASRYGEALRAFVRGGRETDLMEAYEIARIALSGDVTLGEILSVHFDAAAAIDDTSRLSPAGAERIETFMLEFVSVYDMALRGYRTAVPQLHDEIAVRRRAEAALHDKTAELAAERDNLDRMVLERTRELQQRAAELESTLEKLRQTNREQAEFTYAVSHDLKSPSNTISMLVRELQIAGAGKFDAEARELLELTRQTAQRMARLVDDVLAYSRCIETQAPLWPVDLTSLFAEITADLRHDLVRSGAAFTVGALPVVRGDPMQLKLLFQNLVSNALKFRAPDRPAKVSVRYRRIAGDRVLISVRDNGIGIAPEHFERIFGLFKRLHDHASYQGSGIGLALCKRIVGNMGGTIRVTSKPGNGSCFSVTLHTEHP